MRSRSAHRIAWSVPWGLFGLTVALHVFALVLGLGGGVGGTVGFLAVTIGFAGVGALVAARTSNRVGGLFLAEGLALALTMATKAYAGRIGTASLPGAPWVGWIFTIALAAVWSPLLLALLLFPDGRLPSARWRPVAWATVASGAVGVACVAVADVNFSSNFPHLTDPVTIVRAASLRAAYNGGIQAAPLFILLACAVSLVVRLVRSRGEQRLQLKWFVYASALAATVVAIASFVLPDPSVAFAAFAPLIPIGAGISILKYRLYDIDVVINKTLVFGALAGFITGVYVAVVVGIGALVGQGSGRPNLALSIAATAIVAIAFGPVRERVQRYANRLVYGRRATPYQVLSTFASGMGGAVASEDLLPRMAQTLAEGTGARSATVWLAVGGRLVPEATHPADANPPGPIAMSPGQFPAVPGATLALPVQHEGELLGALSITKATGERLSPIEESLMTDLSSQAGLVMRNVRLTEELVVRLEELRASRQRIVAAQDEERRRLERDLHDGSQQQLVGLAVRLRLAAGLAARDRERARAIVDEAETEAQDALAALRDLARGIYPPLLADAGLLPALQAQARKAALPVEVVGTVGRHPREVEAAIYFCCLEALQNAAKCGAASRASIRLDDSDGELMFSITDDGRGFDPATVSDGTGLQGMADRLAALGGELTVVSAPGEGTTVGGHIPIRVMEAVG